MTGTTLTRTPDEALEAAQRSYDERELGPWEMVIIEDAHLKAQPALEVREVQKRGTLVIDRVGRAWRMGVHRWIALSQGHDDETPPRAGHNELVRRFGPIRVIGAGGVWLYRSIRGQR